MQVHNSIIYGGNFVSVNPSEACFQRLVDQVATGALYNSGELSEPSTCHPGTRVCVLEELKYWAFASPYPFPIKWLHGPAGAGKSAIARTIAHYLSLQNLLIATFFFFRAGRRRNGVQHFFATIAYQLCRTIPAARPYILAAIEEDPLIFSQSLSSQAQSLIINPLTRLYTDGQLPPNHPLIIIIDGLDECNGADRQCELLKVMNDLIHRLPFPIALLVASRPEIPIRNSFDAGALNKASSRLALDDQFKPDEDIRRYFLDKFREILDHHVLGSYIGSSHSDPWPGEGVIMLLVQKASGQFIFATTAMLFIGSPRHRPPDRLKIIIGFTPPGNLNPFKQLDNLYSTILATVEDFAPVSRILGARLVPYTSYGCHTPEYLAWFLRLQSAGEIRRLLVDLGSLLAFKADRDPIQVFHASFSDFLFDKSRSGRFYIDPGMIYEELARRCIPLMTEQGENARNLCRNLDEYMSDWFKNADCSPELWQAIKNCDMGRLARFTVNCFNSARPVGLRELCPMFLAAVQNSAFSDAPGLHLQKYSDYEVHLENALGIYLNGDRLTCILLCLQTGAEDFKSGNSPGGWHFLRSLVLPKENDDEGLGLLQYVRPRVHLPSRNMRRKSVPYQIHNRHAQAALCHTRKLVDKLKDIDRLYAEAATQLLAGRLKLPVRSAEMHCIGYLISKSAVRASLADLLSINLCMLAQYGHGNLPSSVVVYLCKYRQICRSRRTVTDRGAVAAEPRFKPSSSVVPSRHPPSLEGRLAPISPLRPAPRLDIQVEMRYHPNKRSISQKNAGTPPPSRMTQTRANSSPGSANMLSSSYRTKRDEIPPPQESAPCSTTKAVQVANPSYLPPSTSSVSRAIPIPARASFMEPSGKATNPKTSSRDTYPDSQESRPLSTSPSRTRQPHTSKPIDTRAEVLRPGSHPVGTVSASTTPLTPTTPWRGATSPTTRPRPASAPGIRTTSRRINSSKTSPTSKRKGSSTQDHPLPRWR